MGVSIRLISLEAFGKYGAWAEALQLLQEMCHGFGPLVLRGFNVEAKGKSFNEAMDFNLERRLSK